MPKSLYAREVDRIQASLRPRLKAQGFGIRGRTFNRTTADGLTQVVNIQMGASDPPGTTYIPGLREDLHGLFTVNLGVYVPEVARHPGGGEAGTWVQAYHCCVRSRLGNAAGEKQDIWWHARADADVLDEVWRLLRQYGLPFLDRFGSRDGILAEWRGCSERMGASRPPRVVMAIILSERGHRDEARALLAEQVLETRNPGHPDYVRRLAKGLGLGDL